METAETVETVKAAARCVAAPLGYDRYVVCSLAPRREQLVDRIYWLEGNWFEDGSEVTYETYLTRCPATRHLLETEEAFFWSKTGDRYQIQAKPEGPGIRGLQVPIFGRTGIEGAASFGGLEIDSSQAAKVHLWFVGTALFRALRRLTDVEEALSLNLSPREREVLRLVSSGWRQTDIATFLCLSERTVENHLRRIRRRLGVATTAHAVQLFSRESSGR